MTGTNPPTDTVFTGRRFRLIDGVLALVLFITLALLVLFIASADDIADRLLERPAPALSIFPNPQTSAGEAADEAARAMETVNLMLDFIQAGSIVLAAVAVVVTGLGVWNNARLREELANARALEDAFAAVQQQAAHATEEVNATRQEVNVKLSQIDSLVDELRGHLETTTHIRDELVPGINLTLLAQRQISMGNLPEALETLKQAHQTHPDNVLIRYLLGDILVRQGEIEDGIAHLEAARAGMENFYDADVAYAYARRIQGDRYTDTAERDIHYAAAKAIFLQVAKERPNLQDISGESAFGALAGLYRREGNLREATRWYENARKATPQNSYPINNLALCYFALDEADEAQKYFEHSRAMAQSRFTLLPVDYYSRFDYVTARLGLHCLGIEDYPAEAMADDLGQVIDLVGAMGVSSRPLQSFKDGLARLEPEQHPAVAEAIAQVSVAIAAMDDAD